MEGESISGSGSSDVGIPALPSLSVTYWRTPCLLGPACQLLNGFGHVRGSSSVVYSLCFYLLCILGLTEVKLHKVWPSLYKNINIYHNKYVWCESTFNNKFIGIDFHEIKTRFTEKAQWDLGKFTALLEQANWTTPDELIQYWIWESEKKTLLKTIQDCIDLIELALNGLDFELEKAGYDHELTDEEVEIKIRIQIRFFIKLSFFDSFDLTTMFLIVSSSDF